MPYEEHRESCRRKLLGCHTEEHAVPQYGSIVTESSENAATGMLPRIHISHLYFERGRSLEERVKPVSI